MSALEEVCLAVLADLEVLTPKERRAVLGRLLSVVVIRDDVIELRGVIPARWERGGENRPEHRMSREPWDWIEADWS